MKNTLTFLFCLIAGVLLNSCDDDFLNTTSTDLTDDLIWNDPELAEVYLMNLYTSIRLADKEPSKDESSQGLTRGHHWALFSSISDESIFTKSGSVYSASQLPEF
jgi:hypothetical protein